MGDSSKGPTLIDRIAQPDIVAPGNRVLSDAGWNFPNPANPVATANTIWAKYYNVVAGPFQRFQWLNGTSMATPVVSAAAAILLQRDPTLTPDQVKPRLMNTANKQFPTAATAYDRASNQAYTTYHDLFTVGAGYLDVAAALANTDKATGRALSPVVTRNTNGTMTLAHFS